MIEKYALVRGTEILDVCVFATREDAIAMTYAVHGEGVEAINVEHINLALPAVYRDGVFYNIKTYNTYDDKGNIIDSHTKEYEAERIFTGEEELANLRQENTNLKLVLASMIGGQK